MPNLASKLVRALGDVAALGALYTEDVVLTLPSSLVAEGAIRGKDRVLAFHEMTWTKYFHPEIEVQILDELAQGDLSAARFIYNAKFRQGDQPYTNEYTFFVRAKNGLIREIYEGVDSYRFMQERPLHWDE